MFEFRSERVREPAFTRISVKSGCNFYLVRTGESPAVKVSRRGGKLECECGGREGRECVHMLSLQMCGFVEALSDWPMAA